MFVLGGEGLLVAAESLLAVTLLRLTKEPVADFEILCF